MSDFTSILRWALQDARKRTDTRSSILEPLDEADAHICHYIDEAAVVCESDLTLTQHLLSTLPVADREALVWAELERMASGRALLEERVWLDEFGSIEVSVGRPVLVGDYVLDAEIEPEDLDTDEVKVLILDLAAALAEKRKREAPRKGDWFQTYTGRQFWPVDPRAEDFDILDIAVGLSNTSRFNGHTRKFYSVAQHSVLVSEVVPPEMALEGLLHDASESYLGDVIRPLKVSLPTYKLVEEKVERALAERFNLRYPWPAEVKAADNRLLMTERRDLLPVQRAWSVRAEPLPEKIEPWTPEDSRAQFLARFEQLTKQRRAVS